MTDRNSVSVDGKIIIAIVGRPNRKLKAMVGDTEMLVPLPMSAHVLVERVTRYVVQGSWEYGPLGTATGIIPRSFLQFPAQFSG